MEWVPSESYRVSVTYSCCPFQYIADTDVGDLLLENQQEYPYNPSEFETEAEPDAEAETGTDPDAGTAEKTVYSDAESVEAVGEETSAATGANSSSAAGSGTTPSSAGGKIRSETSDVQC